MQGDKPSACKYNIKIVYNMGSSHIPCMKKNFLSVSQLPTQGDCVLLEC